MKTINFAEMFEMATKKANKLSKKIPLSSPLGVYIGLTESGKYRISFMSTCPQPKLESTKVLKIVQTEESPNTYWTSFDLEDDSFKHVYLPLCANLFSCIENTKTEGEALEKLKNRYINWKKLFKNEKNSSISREVLLGFFGELYFLNKYMIPQYGIEYAINAWTGPDGRSKDFSTEDTWFEIKTIGANSPIVHISSLAQLSSNIIGHLVIIRTEQMSSRHKAEDSSVISLFLNIVSQIKDERLENVFIQKFSEIVTDTTCSEVSENFVVKSLNFYKVDDKFPKIAEDTIKISEICDVEYSLIVNSLEKYKEK